jgi:hypothetical protein
MENQTRSIGPTWYYFRSLIFTTPTAWIIGLIAGTVVMIQKKSIDSIFFVWWFASALLVFSLFGVQGGGTRYIFFIYPAIGVITAVGIHFILSKYSWGKYLLTPIVLYGLITSIWIHPYYLDYYNEVVGGVKGAAKAGLEISYWGEGQREVGKYLNNSGKRNASVSLLVTPYYVMPSLRHDLKVNKYGVFDEEYYVIVSRTDLPKYQSILHEKYNLVFEAKAGGVALVSLWEKK